MKNRREGNKNKKVIIKIGGSLMDKGRAIVHFLRNYAEEKGKGTRIIIIPGGGIFADFVRNIENLSEETAHWMAILGMHQYGLFLANEKIALVESTEEARTKKICIFLPYKILKADDCLKHSWDVTADTIAAFITKKLGETSFIKVTNVDGIINEKDSSLIREINAKEINKNFYFNTTFLFKKRFCIDNELPYFLIKEKMKCIIINGNFPERIKDAIEGEETICTKIVG